MALGSFGLGLMKGRIAERAGFVKRGVGDERRFYYARNCGRDYWTCFIFRVRYGTVYLLPRPLGCFLDGWESAVFEVICRSQVVIAPDRGSPLGGNTPGTIMRLTW